MNLRERSIISALLTALIDTNALLEHYVEGRKLNWDGSTGEQARRAIRTNAAVIACVRSIPE